MSDNNFHELSLKSSLFKGRPDLYLCYLKSEKIAHATIHLLGGGYEEHQVSADLARATAVLPSTIVHFAADEYDEQSLLADIFETISLLRLSVSYGILEEHNAELLVHEYEMIAEKVALGKRASPFISLEELSVPPLPPETPTLASGYLRTKIKDTKGHSAAQSDIAKHEAKEHAPAHQSAVGHESDRSSKILDIVKMGKRVSVRDIAKVVKGCSEKTIQRELNTLISKGLIHKEGERRWSVYVPN